MIDFKQGFDRFRREVKEGLDRAKETLEREVPKAMQRAKETLEREVPKAVKAVGNFAASDKPGAKIGKMVLTGAVGATIGAVVDKVASQATGKNIWIGKTVGTLAGGGLGSNLDKIVQPNPASPPKSATHPATT